MNLGVMPEIYLDGLGSRSSNIAASTRQTRTRIDSPGRASGINRFIYLTSWLGAKGYPSPSLFSSDPGTATGGYNNTPQRLRIGDSRIAPLTFQSNGRASYPDPFTRPLQALIWAVQNDPSSPYPIVKLLIDDGGILNKVSFYTGDLVPAIANLRKLLGKAHGHYDNQLSAVIGQLSSLLNEYRSMPRFATTEPILADSHHVSNWRQVTTQHGGW